MERGESMSTTKFIVGSLGSLFVGLLVGAFLHKKDIESMPKKEYAVRVVLYGEGIQSTFDCDSATLTHAWKDGIKIDIKNVFQIKFN